MIFNVIGTPSDDDKSFVTDPKALDYLSSFSSRDRKDISKFYPHAGPDALDLLDKILVFNPYFRLTVDQALEHEYLRDIRDISSEIDAH